MSISRPNTHWLLLIAHVICADRQIHNQELYALRSLVERSNADEATTSEVEKIFSQDETAVSLEEAACNVPPDRHHDVLREMVAIARVDGHFCPLERDTVGQVGRLWKLSDDEIERAIADTKVRSNGRDRERDGDEEPCRGLLIATPEYTEAIRWCAEIAKEDFQYAERGLRRTVLALENLSRDIERVTERLEKNLKGEGQKEAAKDIMERVERTYLSISKDILYEAEGINEGLQAKRRSLDGFSIAFMGRTKAGKSTLHAVITGEGWEAIGIGKQRTTRYNRVYEWNGIRIIDTPGIGAPGGKNDADTARGVIEEVDAICYVVTNDSIQETEFDFLKELKERTKPLIVLLNIQYNLRDPRRLEYFLKDPERWFAPDGRNGIGGHLDRINRYAEQHYSNNYLTVIPAMLLAAQLARESEHEPHSEQLFKSSRIEDFLTFIRSSITEFGTIGRSRTLIGSPVGSIDKSGRWLILQPREYRDLTDQLEKKREEIAQRIRRAENDHREELQQNIREIFQSVINTVSSFAEKYWDKGEKEMTSGWNHHLKTLKFESRLDSAIENAGLHFQNDVREAIEEIGNELRLVAQLRGETFAFSSQDASVFDRRFVRLTGMAMMAAGTLAFVFPPLGFLSVAGTVVSWLAGKFKTREQKRSEAVRNIRDSLNGQLVEQRQKIVYRALESFDTHARSVSKAIDRHFEELSYGIGAVAERLESTEKELAGAADYLNRAYAKRIVDWATGTREALSDTTIDKVIRRVERNFGDRIVIETTSVLSLTKPIEEICRILQENTLILPIRSD